MNKSASLAYTATQQASLSGRTLEGRGFAQAANLLREAQEKPDDRRKLIEALKYNQQLWTIVQAALAGDDHAVPTETTEKVLSLSVFVDRRTAELLDTFDVSLLTALIEINRDMAQAQLSSP